MESKKFVLGIAGAHWAAPVFAVDAASTGPIGEQFFMPLSNDPNDDNRAAVCRIDRGTLQLYVVAVIQVLPDPGRAYANMLRGCHACTYMFSGDREAFEPNLRSDFEPFMRAYRALPAPLPFVALINESRAFLTHERVDRQRVREALPAGVPILETTFRYPTEPDGHGVFSNFVDRFLDALSAEEHPP